MTCSGIAKSVLDECRLRRAAGAAMLAATPAVLVSEKDVERVPTLAVTV